MTELCHFINVSDFAELLPSLIFSSTPSLCTKYPHVCPEPAETTTDSKTNINSSVTDATLKLPSRIPKLELARST